MKYSPFLLINKSKVANILHTDGKQYMYENGDEYIGFYYSINGVYYAGSEYTDDSKKLYEYSDDINFKTYCHLKNRIYIAKNNLTPKEYIPVITSKDIDNEYINRYFIRQRNDIYGDIIEINEAQFNSWKKPNEGINEYFYVAVKIQWQIFGYENSTYFNGNIVDGVADYNRKQIENQTVMDLSSKIQSYTEYASFIT